MLDALAHNGLVIFNSPRGPNGPQCQEEVTIASRKKSLTDDVRIPWPEQPPSQLDKEVASLVVELQKSFRTPSSDDADPIAELQDRRVCALMRVAKFLKTIRAGNDVAKEFADLAAALNQLPSGIIHPTLMSGRLSGRRVDRSDVWRLRVLTACGLECLMRSGVRTRSLAARYAAKKFPDLRNLLRPGTTLESSLLSWHNAVLKGKITEPVASGSAREFCKFIEENAAQFTPKRLKVAGDRYLRSAVRQASELLFVRIKTKTRKPLEH
jgi:hypothetical protein